MDNKIQFNQKSNNPIRYSSNSSSSTDYRERRRLEMKKRLGVLHYRRDRLERELEVIKASLMALDHQIQKDKSYEQLSIYE